MPPAAWRPRDALPGDTARPARARRLCPVLCTTPRSPKGAGSRAQVPAVSSSLGAGTVPAISRVSKWKLRWI